MTVSSIHESLLRAGTKLRDQAIRVTGQQVWRHAVEKQMFDAYGTKKVDVQGSRSQTWLIINWDDAEFNLDFVDLSQESEPYVEAYARMVDDWHEGDRVELDVQEVDSETVSTQMYKVSSVKVKRKQFILTKVIGLVPYRTENY